ncbi:MAG: amino acid ABC transporter permease [Anaerolineae bacterium]|nr:amino acid ABC transporter permease [Anaerolineae bacterium]
MATIIDTQLRGTRSFSEYLSLFVAPFLGQVNTAVLALVVAMFAGYFGGQALDRMRSPANAPRRASGRLVAWLWIVLPVLMFVFVYGLGSILPLTDTRRWGGLMLTIMLAAVGIIASFPLGVLLALGRRSSLPIVSLFSTLYIEFVRGVPLITVLFMAQLLVPLVNPTLAELPNVFRAMIGIILFSAAYLAENVRGGLQSIPPGQEEAARALGLNGLQVTLQITLPQALRAVLPALVGQFISLFKDTSLVAIVGLLDFSAMGELIVTQTEFLGLRREVYIFLIVFYFAFTYSIASVSRRIEASGAGKALARKI